MNGVSENEGEYHEVIAPGAFGDTPKAVPLRFGQGGLVIGSATVHPDGTVTVEVNTATTSAKPIMVEIHRPAVTLVEWLREQLDEDERVASAERPDHPLGPWYRQPHLMNCGWGLAEHPTRAVCTCRYPARVLAEVKAKRAILDEAVYLGSDEIVQLLAQPYAGRDGWQAEWATS